VTTNRSWLDLGLDLANRFFDHIELRSGNDHPRWQRATLPRVPHQELDAALDRLVNIGRGQDHVSALASELLMHALDCLSGIDRDGDASPRRSRDGHHIYGGVTGYGVAYCLTVAI